MMETIDFIMQWLAAPVAAFAWMLNTRAQRQETQIAVIRAEMNADKLSRDREMKDVKEALRSISGKLDDLQVTLRDK
jgi:hypothetical protein